MVSQKRRLSSPEESKDLKKKIKPSKLSARKIDRDSKENQDSKVPMLPP